MKLVKKSGTFYGPRCIYTQTRIVRTHAVHGAVMSARCTHIDKIVVTVTTWDAAVRNSQQSWLHAGQLDNPKVR